MKEQLLSRPRLCAVMLLMILAFHPILAQAQAPEIKVTIFRDLVRFAASDEVTMLRVEVFNSTGEKVFDGNFAAAQIFDWPLQDLRGQSVESGLYAYSVTVKDGSGAIKQAQRGNVIVDREREGTEQAPPIDQAQSKAPGSAPPAVNWDVNNGRNPYIINTPAMGVGTQNPLARLHLGPGTAEPVTKGSTLLLEEGAATGMVLKSITGGEMIFSQDKQYGLFGTATDHPLGIRTNNQNRLWITSEGLVGIGTANPGSPLTVAGGIEMTSGGIKFPDGTVQTTAAGGDGDAGSLSGRKNGAGTHGEKSLETSGLEGAWSLAGNADTVEGRDFLGTTNFKPLVLKADSKEMIRITPLGNIGIGVANPEAKFQILGEFSYPPSKLSLGSAYGETLGFGTSYIGFNASRKENTWVFDGDFAHNGGGIIYATVEGKLRFIPKLSSGGSTEILSDRDIDSKVRMIVTEDGVEVAGTTTTRVLQITGGADLSEQFEVRAESGADPDALPQRIEPGLAVSIDPANPGKLLVSRHAYDRTVAGIISGAGGVKPGMLMGQSGTIADGNHPVALTGRVYCWADASNGSINPGDLLTTSNTPGHAMKVADHSKAQGAIIGKAMTALKSGRGLVLVLVTLQ